jgi:hypothetical protein
MQQRIAMDGRHHHDIAAMPSVAAARTAARNVLLAPEREASVAAIAGFHGDFYFIYKHEKSRWLGNQRPTPF